MYSELVYYMSPEQSQALQLGLRADQTLAGPACSAFLL